MKKILIVALCMVLVLSLAGCAVGVPQQVFDSVVAERDRLRNDYDDLQDSYSMLQDDYDFLQSEYDELQDELDWYLTQQESVPQPSVEPLADQQVLVDQNGVLITWTGYDPTGFTGPEIKLQIQNNSDAPITVQARNMSVNGIMVDGLMSVDVAPGKIANDRLTIASWDMEDNNITQVENAEFNFIVLDSDTFDTLFTSDTVSLTF